MVIVDVDVYLKFEADAEGTLSYTLTTTSTTAWDEFSGLSRSTSVSGSYDP